MGIWDAFQDTEGKESEKESACPRNDGACPACKTGTLQYNGKLELECPVCGSVYTAGFT